MRRNPDQGFSLSVFKLTMVFAALAAPLAAPRSAQALHLHREWTWRTKPQALVGEIRFIDNGALFRDINGVLHFMDLDSGKALWHFSAPPDFKIAAAKSVWFLSGKTALYKFDYKGPNLIWKKPLSAPVEDIAALEDRLAVRTEEGEIRSLDPWTAKVGDLLEGEEREAFAEELDRTGPKTPNFPTLNLYGHFFGRKFWVSGDKTGGEKLWEFESQAPLTETAAELKGRISLIDQSGVFYLLNRDTGEVLEKKPFQEIVDPIFWDDARKDDYSQAAIFTHRDALYIAQATSFSKISLNRFPATVERKGAYSSEAVHEHFLLAGLDRWYNKQYPEALKTFDRALSQKGASSLARLFKGLTLVSLQENQAAVAELEAAYHIDPENPDISSSLIQQYVKMALSIEEGEESEKVYAIFDRIRQIDPTLPVSYVELAEILVTQQRYSAAAEILESAGQHGVFGPELELLTACAFYLGGQSDKAIALAAQINTLFPKTPQVNALLGKMHYDKGDYRRAAVSFQLEPPRSNAPGASQLPRIINAGREYFLADSLNLLGHPREAAAVLEDFLNAIPNPGQLTQLEEELARGSGGGTPPSSLSEAAENWLKQGALFELKAMVEYRGPALILLSDLISQFGDREKGLRYLDQLLELSDRLSDSAYSAAGYLLTLYDFKLDEALAMTSKMREKHPGEVYYIQNHAAAMWKKGMHAEAEEAFNKAISIDPKAHTLHYEYARMLEAQGYLKSARAEMETELAVNPGFRPAADALKRLSGE